VHSKSERRRTTRPGAPYLSDPIVRNTCPGLVNNAYSVIEVLIGEQLGIVVEVEVNTALSTHTGKPDYREPSIHQVGVPLSDPQVLHRKQVLLSWPDPVAMALLSLRTRLYTPGLGAPTDDMTGLSRACRLERRAEVAVRASPEAAIDLSRCDTRRPK
jgi:hypothetical protein